MLIRERAPSSTVAVTDDLDGHDAIADSIDREPVSERDRPAAAVPEPHRLETRHRVEALAVGVAAGTVVDDTEIWNACGQSRFVKRFEARPQLGRERHVEMGRFCRCGMS
jgi:hypothetical protein